ncbi:uncharacterized protein [Euwallacea similis]|uniref:uncharacterized protein n=1 Tax=Euwallacea similis TaxID=1736056 RepID=UPI00344E6C9F
MVSLRLLTILAALQLITLQAHHREKRYLLFPFQGTFKTVYSFALPWKLGPKQEMGVGWNFQFQYPLPYNTTAISNYPPSLSRNSRDKRELDEGMMLSDRAVFYSAVEDFLDKQNINGRQCLLKTICENADFTHFDDDGGLLGQILNVFLTPDNGNGPDPLLDEAYSDAQKAGEFGADCNSLYSGCNLGKSFFDLSSIYAF